MPALEEKPRLYMDEYKLKQDPHDYGLADEPIDIETYKAKMRIVIVRWAGKYCRFLKHWKHINSPYFLDMKVMN